MSSSHSKVNSIAELNENTALKEMVTLYQRLHHLNSTGVLDDQTLEQMSAPRCGFPDIVYMFSPRHPDTPITKTGGPAEFKLCTFFFQILEIKK